jgi:uncharacterized protein YdeI (YjbR/CyaY-like superfamily)
MKKSFETLEKVDVYISKAAPEFKPICELLRKIYLEEGLTEEFKWSAPCYSYKGLVCSLAAFKNHAGSWFFQGALLSDPKKVLVCQDGTKALRSIKFTSIKDVDEKQIRLFVKEAMLLNEKGIKVDYAKNRKLVVPDYFKKALAKNKKAEAHFKAFSYSHQREYVDWVTGAKREETRERRILKSIEMLEEGIGKEDKYRKK